jgi:hypothetical protein
VERAFDKRQLGSNNREAATEAATGAAPGARIAAEFFWPLGPKALTRNDFTRQTVDVFFPATPPLNDQSAEKPILHKK